MACVIVEAKFDDRPDDDTLSKTARAIDAALVKRGGRWERSYLSVDGTKLTCEFVAPDAQSVRDAYREAKADFESVWEAERSRAEDSPQTVPAGAEAASN